MSRPIAVCIDERQMATILASLRSHRDENLQGGRNIPDQPIKEIATEGGLLKHLSFEEVSDMCERLNTHEGAKPARGLVIEPPHKEGGDQPLFRVVYVIDVNATSSLDAARTAHRIMSYPDSQAPVLEVIDPRGKVVSIDLSEEAPA